MFVINSNKVKSEFEIEAEETIEWFFRRIENCVKYEFLYHYLGSCERRGLIDDFDLEENSDHEFSNITATLKDGTIVKFQANYCDKTV